MIRERWMINANRVDTDQTSPAPGLHPGQHRLTAEKRGFHRIVDLLLPGSPGRGTEAGARQWGSVIVNENIHLTKDTLDLLHHGFDLPLIADIGFDENSLSALRLDCVQCLLRVAFLVHL